MGGEDSSLDSYLHNSRPRASPISSKTFRARSSDSAAESSSPSPLRTSARASQHHPNHGPRACWLPDGEQGEGLEGEETQANEVDSEAKIAAEQIVHLLTGDSGAAEALAAVVCRN